MDFLGSLVLGVAILWVLRQLWRTRQRLRSGQIVVPPLFATTLVFTGCIVGVLALGASPLHLLWLFLVSFVLGVVLLLFPFGLTLTMACLGLLAGRLEPDQS